MLGSNLDIMKQEWIDVIFKNRNHDYGAYELRHESVRNTNRALLIAVSIFIFSLTLPTIINKINGYTPKADVVVRRIDVKLMPPPPIEQEHQQKLAPPPPVEALPPVQKQVRSRVDVVKFPPPVVVEDSKAKEEPPTDLQLVKATPGQINAKGDPNAGVNIDARLGTKDIDGIVGDKDKGVTEEGGGSGASETVFRAVEINPSFPGGEAAFGKFLQDHIKYPAVARENNVTGRVFVQFIVEKDGSLTDMKILRDPGSGLGEEAVRVLKSSPRWTPGIQNGKKVRVQYTIPVNFSLLN